METMIIKDSKIELLAPAGDITAFEAAIASGANAIYCGLSRFSARAKATNFSLEEIKNAIKYAHLFDVKVYVAINTLIYPHEMNDAIESARELFEANVDAVIVCDLGLTRRLKEELPRLTLHASTQMGIHNLEGTIFAKKLGIKRVILSRETTLEDIRKIKENCDIELEFFAHGALCVGFSGNCYLSSLIMKQSGNRGRCLQLCRKEYLRGEQKGYYLSTKDIDMSKHIHSLIDAGITSFKLEGRMRKREYVSIVTKAYRNILDGIAPSDEMFKNTYLRGGGTTAHLFNANENTICDLAKGHINTEKPNIGEIEIVEKKLKINMFARIMSGMTPEIELICNNISIKENGRNKVQQAKNAPIKKEDIEKFLRKCGGTVFEIEKFLLECDDNIFISVKELNELRRQAIAKLENEILKNYTTIHKIAGNSPLSFLKTDDDLRDIGACTVNMVGVYYKRMLAVNSFSQIQFAPTNIDCIIYVTHTFEEVVVKDFVARAKEKLDLPIYLNLPNVAREGDVAILKNLVAKNIVDGYIINNLYAFELTKGKSIILGTHLNIVNDDFDYSSTQRILSFESRETFSHHDIVYAFGKPSVMTLCHCPNNQKCGYRCGRDFFLKDEKGANFVLKRTKIKHCYFNMHHNIPINILPLLDDGAKVKAPNLLFDFSGLNEKELKELDFNELSKKPHQSTRGHFGKGVE